jgi:hypothetical protein
MSTLGSHVSEAEDIDRQRKAVGKWISDQENVVAEMLKRPAKLRSEAAQLDVNLVTDMRQAVADKGDHLEELEARRAALGLQPDHELKIALDTLDEHVRYDSPFPLLLHDIEVSFSSSYRWGCCWTGA